MANIWDPQFFQPFEITWPCDNPVAEVREFIDDDGNPVREVVQVDGTRTRHPVGRDIHL
jgi:hypothetical protein